MKRTRNILSGRLLAAVLAVMLLCMPAFAWGDSWGKSSAFEVQTTNGGLDSLSAEEWFNEGNALYDLGKHDEAIKAYDRSISINPQYAEAWINKGNALYGLGKYDEAIKAYDQAISINPQFAEAWYNKGNALYGLGKYDEAIKAYDQAISINPQFAEAWNNKGNALYGLGKYDEAIKAYDQAISINPQYAEAWSNKGNALRDLGKHDEAIKAYDRAISINPQYAEAWYNKGNALYGLGKYDEAIKAYDQAISINPQYAEAWYNKGNALYGLGKYDEAIKAYDQAISINPQFAEAWNNKGITLDNLGKYDEAVQAYDEAIKAYDQAISINPQFADAWYNKGNALKALRKYDEAIKAYDQAISINPQDAKAWFNKGVVLELLGRTNEANEAYAKARELDESTTISKQQPKSNASDPYSHPTGNSLFNWEFTIALTGYEQEYKSIDIGELALANKTGLYDEELIDENLTESSSSAIEIKSKINGGDASSPSDVEIRIGEIINWIFEIANPGASPLSEVEVNDSRFDVYPIYKSGDVNGDVLLDPGEVWIFEAQSIAEEGDQENTAGVCGVDGRGNRLCDTDTSYYSGVSGETKAIHEDQQNIEHSETSIAPAEQETNSIRSEDYSSGEILYSAAFPNGDIWKDIHSYHINQNGQRHITVSRPGSFSCHWPTKKPFSDFVLDVETTVEGGPADNAYGVVLRQQSSGREFYRFKISSDGYYGFDLRKSAEWEDIVPWTKSDVINTGKASNQIRVVCQGSTFSYEVNGVKLGECTDNTLASGMVGFIVEALSQGGVEVAFGNFTIRELPGK